MGLLWFIVYCLLIAAWSSMDVNADAVLGDTSEEEDADGGDEEGEEGMQARERPRLGDQGKRHSTSGMLRLVLLYCCNFVLLYCCCSTVCRFADVRGSFDVILSVKFPSYQTSLSDAYDTVGMIVTVLFVLFWICFVFLFCFLSVLF
jgi:hypothetical protein